MKTRSLGLCLTLLVAYAPAFALTVSEKVTPKWTKENGVTVKTERNDDGTVGFTVTRYLDNAPRYDNDPDLTTRRIAHLKMRSTVQVLLQTMVAGEIKNNSVVYQFDLAPQSIQSTHFSLSESPAYKDPTKQELIIGGIIYEFDLSEFAASLIAPDHP